MVDASQKPPRDRSSDDGNRRAELPRGAHRVGCDQSRVEVQRGDASGGLRRHKNGVGTTRRPLKLPAAATDRDRMDAGAVARMRLTWLAVGLGSAVTVPLIRVGADARWLAAMGRAIVRTGSIPDRVPYAAASSAHWANVPALAELVFHGLEVSLGDRGLVLAQVAAVVVAMVALVLDMRLARIPDAARATAIVAVLLAAAPAFLVSRAQLFSLALFPLLVLLLRAEARSPSRRIWLLVPLSALWANLHGAVLVGLGIAVAYLIFERLRRDPLIAIGAIFASAGATFLTPALLRSGSYYAGIFHSQAATSGEGMWAPLSPHSPFDIVFVAVAIPLIVFALRSRPMLWELVCLAVLAIAAIDVSRNTVWFALFVATPAAKQLGRGRLAQFELRRRAAAMCYCAALLVLVVGFAQPAGATSAGNPLLRRAIAVAKGAPILADDLDAEQLALRGARVWIANPVDAFTSRDQQSYLAWLDGDPAGDGLLHRVGGTILVFRGSPPDERLRRDRDYRVVARDRVAVLYVRAGSRELSARRSRRT
jgi:hypothetical protein